ncbi:MAG: DUF882 domain-containing protein [Elusimicrobiales bacterium]|nr:DUF882 domain-containing protein [Elusimicrobiales bacterium]
MFFLKLCLSLLVLSAQNIFLLNVNISTTQSKLFQNDLIDININNSISNFSFEDLIISSNNLTEHEIREIEEEEEIDSLNVIYSLIEPQPVNLGGDGLITIIRKETGESITVRYRNEDGSYNDEALVKINHIARCSLTGEERKIPVKLMEVIDKISDKFGKKQIILLSGYRTKPLNDITPGAAKRSLHLIGWAMDIKINGVPTRKIKDYAKSLKFGGVGYYPAYGFIHIDIGKVRYWQKYQYRKKTKYAKKISKNKIYITNKVSKNKSNSLSKKK